MNNWKFLTFWKLLKTFYYLPYTHAKNEVNKGDIQFFFVYLLWLLCAYNTKKWNFRGKFTMEDQFLSIYKKNKWIVQKKTPSKKPKVRLCTLFFIVSNRSWLNCSPNFLIQYIQPLCRGRSHSPPSPLCVFCLIIINLISLRISILTVSTMYVQEVLSIFI